MSTLSLLSSWLQRLIGSRLNRRSWPWLLLVIGGLTLVSGFAIEDAVQARARSADGGLGAQELPLAMIDERDLPLEARRVLSTIQQGGPFADPKDGVVFFNREKLLPYRPRGYYTEYTVRTRGLRNRGARRIVAGGDPRTSGVYYYTEDHYQSFKQIRK